MLTFLIVLITISILILAHELGHFYSARKLGVRVEEFGFGFPPKIWSRTKNGILYTINLLPLGGFVKIYGEHGEGEENQQSFISRPVWQRFVILASGVFMNLVLAWIFFSLGSVSGTPQISEDESVNIPVSIVAVIPDTPAEKAGLKFGDKILEMRALDFSMHVKSEKDVQDFISAYRGEEIIMLIARKDKTFEIKTIPRETYPDGEGPLGIALARLTIKHTPWYQAPWEGAKTIVKAVILTVEGIVYLLKEIFIERKTAVAVSGPVGIFMLMGDVKTLGMAYLLQFVAMLSVNLAVLNFLPIPALDGGRVLFLIIEKARRKKFKPEWENFAHTVGFALLLVIMILVTYKDIIKIL